jgi:hypothetical protein
MKRRTFIKAAAAITASSYLPKFVEAPDETIGEWPPKTWTNEDTLDVDFLDAGRLIVTGFDRNKRPEWLGDPVGMPVTIVTPPFEGVYHVVEWTDKRLILKFAGPL